MHGFVRFPVRFCFIEPGAYPFDLDTSIGLTLNIFDKGALRIKFTKGERQEKKKRQVNYLRSYNFRSNIEISNCVESNRKFLLRPFTLHTKDRKVSL